MTPLAELERFFETTKVAFGLGTSIEVLVLVLLIGTTTDAKLARLVLTFCVFFFSLCEVTDDKRKFVYGVVTPTDLQVRLVSGCRA